MATMATGASSILSLPRSSHKEPSQMRVRRKQSERRFLASTRNLEVCNSDCLVQKWRVGVSFFPSFLNKKRKSREEVKEELLNEIEPLDRGAEATPEDQERIDQIASELETLNTIKEPLKSDFLNGKWELLYTTSSSILKTQWPKILRPKGKIYQAINADTLRAQNMETWPYFNQATANLVPLSSKRVAVRFNNFKIFGLIPIKAQGSGRGQLEITYLDEEIRVSRGNQGNLFILKMVDCTYQPGIQSISPPVATISNEKNANTIIELDPSQPQQLNSESSLLKLDLVCGEIPIGRTTQKSLPCNALLATEKGSLEQELLQNVCQNSSIHMKITFAAVSYEVLGQNKHESFRLDKQEHAVIPVSIQSQQ